MGLARALMARRCLALSPRPKFAVESRRSRAMDRPAACPDWCAAAEDQSSSCLGVRPVTFPVQIGQRYGQLTVQKIIPQGAGKSRRILCLCDCGRLYETNANRLYLGKTTRCINCANPKWFPSEEYDHHVRHQFHNYRNGARRRGYDYLLTRENFREIYLADCTYCGISPSKGIDRRDNSLGYLLENCVPCCKDCNLAKRDMSEESFLAWVARIAAKQGFSL